MGATNQRLSVFLIFYYKKKTIKHKQYSLNIEQLLLSFDDFLGNSFKEDIFLQFFLLKTKNNGVNSV